MRWKALDDELNKHHSIGMEGTASEDGGFPLLSTIRQQCTSMEQKRAWVRTVDNIQVAHAESMLDPEEITNHPTTDWFPNVQAQWHHPSTWWMLLQNPTPMLMLMPMPRTPTMKRLRTPTMKRPRTPTTEEASDNQALAQTAVFHFFLNSQFDTNRITLTTSCKSHSRHVAGAHQFTINWHQWPSTWLLLPQVWPWLVFDCALHFKVFHLQWLRLFKSADTRSGALTTANGWESL